MDKLYGTITAKKSISGQVAATKSISGKVGIPTEIHDRYPPYEGTYSVTPRIGAQTLDTDYKSLTDDIEISAIPVMRVDNPYGGETITIAYD